MECTILEEIHTFGIKMLKTVSEAFALDKKKDNTLWAEENTNATKEVKVTF